MKIYNLFPLLAGPFSNWQPHLKRAADMGFDWIFVNPIQQPGMSGSLYSIADYFKINEKLLDRGSEKSPEDQVKEMASQADSLGLRMMVDLVINHCAVDSSLVNEHREWFVRDGDQVAHPFCLEDNGSKIVWGDLAQLDHRGSPDREGLLRYCIDVVEYLVGLGFTGFRCDAAYQIPRDVWSRIIEHIRQQHPDVVFAAETLGCSPRETKETASAGFDYVFNSSKWWDFSSPWLLEQYELTRQIAPSIGFPESHDTDRLFTESGNNVDALKQRYLFAALFSAGVMMPIGYEYGFRNRLHVVETRPEHWEEPAVDLTDFITRVNRIKGDHPLFREEGPLQKLDYPDPSVLMFWKASTSGNGEALVALNKDPWNRKHFHCYDLYRHVQDLAAPLRDVSPEWPVEHLPTPFDFELGPGMGRVMVSGAS
jgi:starch synthase (maltosyl-transferring)